MFFICMSNGGFSLTQLYSVDQCTSSTSQKPRSQFKRRDKFELTRIFPTNAQCKNCHQEESKNYTTFCPHAFRAKGDSMCHVYPVEDCVDFGGSRVIYSNYHTSLFGTNFKPQPFSNQRNVEISVIC